MKIKGFMLSFLAGENINSLPDKDKKIVGLFLSGMTYSKIGLVTSESSQSIQYKLKRICEKINSENIGGNSHPRRLGRLS